MLNTCLTYIPFPLKTAILGLYSFSFSRRMAAPSCTSGLKNRTVNGKSYFVLNYSAELSHINTHKKMGKTFLSNELSLPSASVTYMHFQSILYMCFTYLLIPFQKVGLLFTNESKLSQSGTVYNLHYPLLVNPLLANRTSYDLSKAFCRMSYDLLLDIQLLKHSYVEQSSQINISGWTSLCVRLFFISWREIAPPPVHFLAGNGLISPLQIRTTPGSSGTHVGEANAKLLELNVIIAVHGLWDQSWQIKALPCNRKSNMK